MNRLPDFFRAAWVSDLARDTWKPRFEAIREAWPRVILSAAAGSNLECGIRTLPPWMIFRLQAEAARQGLTALVLGTRGLATPGHVALGFTVADGLDGRPFLYDIVLGREAACTAVEQLWQKQQYSAAYRLAGAPECCGSAMDEDRVLQRADPVWRYTDVGRNVDADATSISDPLWSGLNLGALSFAPCTLACAAARTSRDDLATLARNFGCGQEMDWLDEALTWPLEWTALHGIAELKTPVLKATWSTDVAHRKATLRYHGAGYPKEGAIGLDFPFRSPSRPLLTSSQAFQRGMANLIQIRS